MLEAKIDFLHDQLRSGGLKEPYYPGLPTPMRPQSAAIQPAAELPAQSDGPAVGCVKRTAPVAVRASLEFTL